MPRLHVTVSKQTEKALKGISDEIGTPVSKIVREALAEWAQKRGFDLKDSVSWGGVRQPQEQETEALRPDAARAAAPARRPSTAGRSAARPAAHRRGTHRRPPLRRRRKMARTAVRLIRKVSRNSRMPMPNRAW